MKLISGLILSLAASVCAFNVVAAGDAKPVDKKTNAAPASAAKSVESMGPYELIDHVSETLLALVKSDAEQLKNDPDAFFLRVRSIMERAVNFEIIAKGVMGGYWNAATPEQRKQFTEVFTTSLVETYGKGMANFAELDVKTESSKAVDPTVRRVLVTQIITSPTGETRVSYTVARGGSGRWMVLNVILDGVNLGESFRNQFARAAKEQNGDIGATIKDWSRPKIDPETGKPS